MQKSYLKTLGFEKETVVSEEGEVLDSTVKVHTYIADRKEEFFLCYTSLLGVFMDMSIAEIKTYAYLLQRYANGTHFDISKKIRVDIGLESGLNERSIYNIIPSLENKKLLIKLETSGLYQLNPRYAFKGSSAERNNQLKMILELHCRDC